MEEGEGEHKQMVIYFLIIKVMHDCVVVWHCMLLGMIVIGAQKYCSARKYAIKILNFTTMHATCHNSISALKNL